MYSTGNPKHGTQRVSRNCKQCGSIFAQCTDKVRNRHCYININLGYKSELTPGQDFMSTNFFVHSWECTKKRTGIITRVYEFSTWQLCHIALWQTLICTLKECHFSVTLHLMFNCLCWFSIFKVEAEWTNDIYKANRNVC